MVGFKVRDFRDKGFFMLDDAYLNGYARYLGTTASMVYISLCRHADKEQKSFPSQKLIGEELGIHERVVMRKIKDLEDWRIIEKRRTRNKTGKFLYNTYYLLSKTEWKQPPTQKVHVDNPPTQIVPKPPTQNMQYKETHKKETHIYDENIKLASKKTNPLRLTRGQIFAYLKAFPGLTTSELYEQSDLCNNYMGMSSWDIKNPGLFFRKWLSKYIADKKAKQLQEAKLAEQDKYMPELTPEEREKNFKKIEEIRKGVLSRL